MSSVAPNGIDALLDAIRVLPSAERLRLAERIIGDLAQHAEASPPQVSDEQRGPSDAGGNAPVPDPRIVSDGGLLVFSGPMVPSVIPDHRALREERAAELIRSVIEDRG